MSSEAVGGLLPAEQSAWEDVTLQAPPAEEDVTEAGTGLAPSFRALLEPLRAPRPSLSPTIKAPKNWRKTKIRKSK